MISPNLCSPKCYQLGKVLFSYLNEGMFLKMQIISAFSFSVRSEVKFNEQ